MEYTNKIRTKKSNTKKPKPTLNSRPDIAFFMEALQLKRSSPPHKNTTVSAKMRRCRRGTQKYPPLGPNCYTQAEINIYKQNNLKSRHKKRSDTNLTLGTPNISPVVSGLDAEFDPNPTPKEVEIILPPKKLKKQKTSKNVSAKRRLKIPVELVEVEQPMIGSEEIEKEKETRYNEAFIELMEQLSAIMLKNGEPFRARAYQKAQETIMAYPDDILSPKQLEGQPGIGSTIMEKLNEYVETGTLRVLEREKTNPINILADVYGIGPKKAAELVAADVKTIETLRQRQDELLNDVQKVGLKYYEQIQERIPRSEIEEFNHVFESVFSKVAANSLGAKYEIVGSYRRGAKSSGDIDVIITGSSNDIYTRFINELLKTAIIIEVLSRGQSKTLVIAKLPDKPIARRVDFLFAPPNEFAFAILYFTGSKIFNTVMRQRALNQGYTFNEHGIYHLENKKKGKKVEQAFQSEKDIFDFLGLQFKEPNERKDGRSIVGKKMEPIEVVPTQIVEPTNEVVAEETIVPVKKNRTLKKRAKVATKVDEAQQNTDTSLLTLVDSFKQNGISVLQNLSEQELANIIQFANAQYYNEQPVLTDNQYDIMREFAEAKFPNNANIQAIGADVERNKAKLPHNMGSMNKIKPDTGALEEWKHKFSGPYVISCKLDGVSGLYTTEHGTPKLYTRGNGTVGQDVSHLIPYLRLPKAKGIAIRGEFIVPKEVFAEKYKQTFANARNMVAGIINHKTISGSVVDLHFVAYEVIVPRKTPLAQMEYLGTLNVERVLYQEKADVTNESLSELLVDLRGSYMYEIDGIIVTSDKLYPRKSGNPEHSIAFKMVLSDQVAEAKVVDVIWTPSKDGYLKPRVQIEPIHLGGVTIEYATGFNAAFIEQHNIGIGATIEIVRSGDVIPHIKEVTVPAPAPKMPSVPYKWNATHVDILLENAADDPTVKEKNITGFFRGLEVDGLSSGNISRLTKSGYDTVPKIITMTEPEFLTVEGFKTKMANKIYTGIQDKLKAATIIDLMAASNIFGRGFSDKKMELIMSELPNILVSEEPNANKVKQVAAVKGMAGKTAEAFVAKIDDFKEFLAECGLEDKLQETPVFKPVDQSHILFDKNVVLTGTRDKQIIDFLKTVGANQTTSVSQNTYLVITKSADEDTEKAEQARKLNVPIMTIEEFAKQYLIA